MNDEVCEFCKNLECIHCKAVKLEEVIKPIEFKIDTSSWGEADIEYLNSYSSETGRKLGEESMFVIKDSTTEIGYVHVSSTKCYNCTVTSHINQGPKKISGLNCFHSLCVAKPQEPVLEDEEPAEKVKEDVFNKLNSCREVITMFKEIPGFLNVEDIKKKLKSLEDIKKSFSKFKENKIYCCNEECMVFKYPQEREVIVLTVSDISRQVMPLKLCEHCKCIKYPELVKDGYLFFHNKVKLNNTKVSWVFDNSLFNLLENESIKVRINLKWFER